MRTLDCGDFFVVMPDSANYRPGPWAENARPVPPGFTYASNTNTYWVSVEEMRQLMTSLGGVHEVS